MLLLPTLLDQRSSIAKLFMTKKFQLMKELIAVIIKKNIDSIESY